MRPLVETLAPHVMSEARVHADDTLVPVLEPSGSRTRLARLWVYARDDSPFGGSDPPAVLYRYSPDRKDEHFRTHLATSGVFCMRTAMRGSERLYAEGRITEVSSCAHPRRGFFGAHEKTKSPLAREALDRIGALYRVEDSARGHPPDERLRLRVERSAPPLSDLRASLEATWSRISGRSDLARAIRYTLLR